MDDKTTTANCSKLLGAPVAKAANHLATAESMTNTDRGLLASVPRRRELDRTEECGYCSACHLPPRTRGAGFQG